MSKSYFVDANGKICAELEDADTKARIAIPPGHSILTEDMIARVCTATAVTSKDTAVMLDEVVEKLALTKSAETVEPVEEITK